MFKKIKFNVANENFVDVMEDKNVSLEEAIEILKNPNVINFKAIKMTNKEYLRKTQGIKL